MAGGEEVQLITVIAVPRGERDEQGRDRQRRAADRTPGEARQCASELVRADQVRAAGGVRHGSIMAQPWITANNVFAANAATVIGVGQPAAISGPPFVIP